MADDYGQLTLNTTSYEFDYFSGAQISIYIGDILVDDVQHIQFQVTQSKRPIYGYASQYYHKLADGQVLVEGMFSIPFKEADYILATLQRYREAFAPISMRQVPDVEGLMDRGKKTYLVERRNIEQVVKGENDRMYDLYGNRYEFYRDLAALSDEDFENQAEVFEDVLWQGTRNITSDFDTGNLSMKPKGEDANTHRRGDQYPPFDIWILYGDISNAEANHTIKKIVSASIVGQGQVISADGQPIQEQYRFVARNLA